MRRSIQQFFAMASLTALEAFRQPVTLLIFSTALAGMALMPVVTTHTLGESKKMVADSALALHFFLGLLLAGLAACHTLTSEIRRGTAASVLSKPVGRTVFILAKFAGVAAVMLVFSGLCTAGSILAARAATESYFIDWRAAIPMMAAVPLAYAAAGLVNYLTRRPFVSDAILALVLAAAAAFALTAWLGLRTPPAPDESASFFEWRMVPVNALIAMALLVLAALALALATRLQAVPVVSICSVVFLAGLMSDYLLGRHAKESFWAAAAYAILPNWQHFWLVDALHLEEPVPLRYLGEAGLYALLYLSGILLLGIVSFRHTEVKS